MKIKHIIVLSLSMAFLQGCAVQHYSQEQVQEAKCKNKAYEQTREAVIRSKVDTKFAYDEVDTYKAEVRYSKTLEKINRTYHSCVQRYQKKVFEDQLRYQMSYNKG